ncbi:MAG: hypothetical protein COC06_10660 [Bacteroidales bacterium]|nr:MAG: hypothetical protein COC06_10660 [Bacteroidales bacterium]
MVFIRTGTKSRSAKLNNNRYKLADSSDNFKLSDEHIKELRINILPQTGTIRKQIAMNKKENKGENLDEVIDKKLITRKAAIKKTIYVVAATSMMMILAPKDAPAQSSTPSNPPGW